MNNDNNQGFNNSDISGNVQPVYPQGATPNSYSVNQSSVQQQTMQNNMNSYQMNQGNGQQTQASYMNNQVNSNQPMYQQGPTPNNVNNQSMYVPNNFNNSYNQPTNNKKPFKLDIKIIIIVAVVIVLIVVGVILVPKFLNDGKKNTTGLSGYSDKDVDYNCVMINSSGQGKSEAYSDVIFDYTSGSNIYQVAVFSKIVMEKNENITDEVYKETLNSISGGYCIAYMGNDCTKNHIEMGITSLGWNTIVDRSGNKLTITYYNLAGMDEKASNNDRKEIIEELEQGGFSCK